MINKIDNVSFSSRFRMGGYSKHTPVQHHYEEFHFMPELKYKNPLVEMFKKIGNAINRIIK